MRESIVRWRNPLYCEKFAKTPHKILELANEHKRITDITVYRCRFIGSYSCDVVITYIMLVFMFRGRMISERVSDNH